MNRLTVNGFSQVVADIVGDHLKWVKHTWVRAGSPADMGVSYVAIMPSMRAGEVLWQDSKVTDLVADYVVSGGIPGRPREGYNPYSSMMLLDDAGILCTFTSSSWGGRNALTSLIPQFRIQGQRAFPLVELSSRAKNNVYGTVDPVFKIIGWEPRAKFAAILGEEPDEPLAIAAPEPAPEAAEPASEPTPVGKKQKRTSAEIIGDDIPFLWLAALLPLAAFLAERIA